MLIYYKTNLIKLKGRIMNKKNFSLSALTLIFSALITKILALLSKMIMSKQMSVEQMSYYMLATPTMLLLINIAKLSLDSAIAKLISSKKHSHRTTIYFSIVLSIINNLLLCLIISLFFPLLANYFFKQPLVLPTLYLILPLLPLVTITSIIKGYLLGIDQIKPTANCHITEEIARIIFIILFIKPENGINNAYLAMFSISVGEIFAIIHLLFALGNIKNKYQKLTQVTFDFGMLQDLFSLCIPMTASKLLGSFIYFLEPIIIFALLGKSLETTKIYGSFIAYILPMITMCSFITLSLANILLPTLTKFFENKNYTSCLKLTNLALMIAFITNFIYCLFLFFYPNELMYFFFHQTIGSNYLKAIALPFSLFALQAPLTSCMYALDKTKEAFYQSLLGSLLRLILIFIFAQRLKFNGYILSLFISMFFTTFTHFVSVYSTLYSSLHHKPCK